MLGVSIDFGVVFYLDSEIRRKAIADREDEYHAQRLKAVLSPVRADPFIDGMDYSKIARFVSDAVICVLSAYVNINLFFHGLDLNFRLRSPL